MDKKNIPLVTDSDIEAKVKLIDKRLIALGHQIDDAEGSDIICELIGLRSNLLLKRRALKDRLIKKTINQMEYHIAIIQ